MISRAHLKYLRSLRQKKVRAEEGVLLLEGPNSVEAAIQGGFGRELLLTAEAGETERGRALLALAARSAHVHVHVIEERDAQALAETESPSGCFALAATPVRPFDASEFGASAIGEECLLLVAAGVADPGNFGTLIRAAAALGARGLVATAGSVEPTNPKVVRASAGALFRLPIRVGEARAVKAAGFSLWIGDAQGEPIDGRGTRPARLALLLGSEPRGVEASVASLADARVAVPLRGGVESLNVAVAGGILLFAARQLALAASPDAAVS